MHKNVRYKYVLKISEVFQNSSKPCVSYGITVRLGTVSVGAIGFMSIRNKYGRTLVNPNVRSADTWS